MIVSFRAHLFAGSTKRRSHSLIRSEDGEKDGGGGVMVIEGEDVMVEKRIIYCKKLRPHTEQIVVLVFFRCCCGGRRRHYLWSTTMLSCCGCCWFRLLRENQSTADIFVLSDFPSFSRTRLFFFLFTHSFGSKFENHNEEPFIHSEFRRSSQRLHSAGN